MKKPAKRPVDAHSPATGLDAVLQIDSERGVIYVHSATTGETLLRIGSLPAPIPDPRLGKGHGALDILHMFGVNWDGKVRCPRCQGAGEIEKRGPIRHGERMHSRCPKCHGNRTVPA